MTLQYELPSTLRAEIDGLEESIKQYRNGSLDPIKFKGIRVPFGVYEQRKDDTYMVRMRCAAGIITPTQLRKAAELSVLYGAPMLHVTTRGALQIHNVKLEDTVKVIKELFEIGLATRGGGGNTVRNIIASVNSGIDPEEIFDVTPYAVALTTALIAEPDSWSLPRKYKIAFSNSPKDTAHAAFTDLGFIATLKDNKKGFRVYVAGGLGSKPRTGHLLYDFVLPEKVYPLAEGLKQLFGKYGNRKNRHMARLRYLWEKLGPEEFTKLLAREVAEVESSNKTLSIPKEEEPSIKPGLAAKQADNKEFSIWKTRYVLEQKQKGLYTIKLPLRLGDIRNEDAKGLAELLGHFGEDTIRFSTNQNIHLRNIPERYLGNLFEQVSGMATLSNLPELIGDMVACTGANTCKLGITLARGAADAITKALSKIDLDLDAINGFRIQISGCPNACGRHLTADLGFFGKAGRKEGRVYPAYNVVAGSMSGNGQAQLALRLGEISSRELPNLVFEVLRDFITYKKNYGSFTEYVQGEGAEAIRSACERYQDIPLFEEDRNYYYDWGAEEVFSLAGRGVGECSAGILDLIENDASRIKKGKDALSIAASDAEAEHALYQIVLAGSRMLLVTKGIEAKTEQEVFEAFTRQFIDPGIVPEEYRTVINAAASGDATKLIPLKQEAIKLSEIVLELYRNMDDSFSIKPAQESVSTPDTTTQKAQKFKDYRGVACPMNFVKVKADLAGMQSGEILEVLLDDGAPIENVPASLKEQGHEVLHKKKINDHWSLLIKKA